MLIAPPSISWASERLTFAEEVQEAETYLGGSEHSGLGFRV